MKTLEMGAVCLGIVGATASWRRVKADAKNRFEPMLVIQLCGGVEDGAYTPPSDITIANVQGLLALREAIDEALKYDSPSQKEGI